MFPLNFLNPLQVAIAWQWVRIKRHQMWGVEGLLGLSSPLRMLPSLSDWPQLEVLAFSAACVSIIASTQSLRGEDGPRVGILEKSFFFRRNQGWLSSGCSMLCLININTNIASYSSQNDPQRIYQFFRFYWSTPSTNRDSTHKVSPAHILLF